MPLVRTISSHPSLSNYLSYDMYHLCSLLYQYISEHEKIRIALYVSTGYLILISIGFWYLRHNRTLVGRTVLRQQTVFFKVLLFILLELVLFPIVCGFFLDLSTLPFFKECSLMDRIEFVQHNPYSSIFLHWFVGTGFIYKFSVFISHVREVVRPGVLWFIRDPSDPQFHPVQEMVEQPILSLFKRFMSNAATYFMLIMVGMGLVSLLICRYTSIPPIVWTFRYVHSVYISNQMKLKKLTCDIVRLCLHYLLICWSFNLSYHVSWSTSCLENSPKEPL